MLQAARADSKTSWIRISGSRTNMAKVLLTGGSGFIAAHVLKVLLDRGYTVVATVRSAAKGDQILKGYDRDIQNKLSYVIVPDIAKDGAFDEAIISDPPFDCVIHTASPFPTSFDDPVKDVLSPALKGTVGILQAIKTLAPSVKRTVITSSFAAMVQDPSPNVYDEACWNPITWEEATTIKSKTYRGSKTLAEKAGWDFVAQENPTFDLVTMCPPLVYGPIEHHVTDMSSLNTSNQRIRDLIQGKHAEDTLLSSTGSSLFIDVRDLALAHVRALEVAEAGGKRFFVTGGHSSGKMIVDIIRELHPELAARLPNKNLQEDLPPDIYGYDNRRARQVLGIQFRSLKECIGDTTISLLALGA